MTDLHMHSSFSCDSDENAENYVLAAKAKGATALGFSEHYDYDVYLEDGGKECPLPDLSAYSKKIEELNSKYPDIKVLKGVELGFSDEAIPHYKRLLKEQSFDFVILSVHTLKGRGDCYFPEFYEGLTKKQAYENYLKAVLNSVCSGLDYQIIGHIGYVTRYAPYNDKRIIYGEFSSILDEILTQIIKSDKCLEINTSARGTGDLTIPNSEIIRRYISLGGKNFTLGSDSHSAQKFMQNFSAVKDMLLSYGITHTCRFENGERIKEKL